MKSLGRDERAVSEVLGAILMFGLVLALLSIVQLQAVPMANERVEVKHSATVEDDLGALGSAVSRASTTGAGETVEVKTGLQYPNRFVFYNPPPSSGTLRTSEPRNVTLTNAVGASGARSYLNGDTTNFTTRNLIYRPDYNRYESAPVTVFEPGVRYERHPTAIQPETVSLVDGRTISLVALAGDVSVTDAGTTELRVRPVSAPSQSVTVHNASEAITLTLPTNLTVAQWTEALANQRCTDTGASRSTTENDICDRSEDGDPSTHPDGHVVDIAQNGSAVDITLEKGVTYDLRLSKVRLGDGSVERDPHYLVAVAGNETSVDQGGSKKLTVQVRDRFNNPVSGVEVEFSVPATQGRFDQGLTATVTTDSDGRASVRFHASPSYAGPATVTAARDLDQNGAIAPREQARFGVGVQPGSLLGAQINPPRPVFLRDANTDGCTLPIGNCQVPVTFENAEDTSTNITKVRVSFYSRNSVGLPANLSPNPPASVTFEGTTMQVGGQYQHVSTDSIDPKSPITYQFAFDSGRYAVNDGDYFVFSVVYQDGAAATYFVAPD